MGTKSPLMDDVMDCAEDWLARLNSPECTEADRAAFKRWQQDHPGAIEACAQVEHILALSRTLSRDPWLAMVTRSTRRQTLRRRDRRVNRRGSYFAWAATAAAVLLVAGGLLFWRAHDSWVVQPIHYATSIGEQRTIYFDDGTAVLLDTDSALTVRYDTHQRKVTMDRGRAQFEVAPDPRRPFLVHAGNGLIRDIGTRFQVRLRGDDVTVTLLRGVVRVTVPPSNSSSTLAPGQQVSYADGGLGAIRNVDLAVANGWTHGKLVFENRTLADLVAEMNRYSTQKLQLGNPALGKLRISGVFHAGDQASLVQGLHQGWGLRARQVSPRTIVIEPPAEH